MSPNIWPPSCSVTNGELNPPAAPVWNSGIACITFATRSTPSATPEITCAAESDFCCASSCGFISCCELRVEVLRSACRRARAAATARPAPPRPAGPASCGCRAPRRAAPSRSRRAATASAFGVLALEHLQRHRAEAADLLREPHRATEQEAEAVVRRRRVEAGDHAAEVDAGRGRAHEQPGIDRRIEQRQLPHDALDVHAVADLEQPVGDRVPVLVELRVGRRAEVLRGHAEHRRGAAASGPRVDAERPPHLEVLERAPRSSRTG